MRFFKKVRDILEDLEAVYSDCDDEDYELISKDDVEKDDTDDVLYEFYYKVLNDLLDSKNKKNVDYFRLYCKLIRQNSNSFCKLNKGAPSDLKNSFFDLISQLYRNGPIVSSTIAHFFQKSADFDSQILKGLLDKSEINICTFGGFPADIVGIVHKLCYAAAEKGCDLNINLTVIDNYDKAWEDICRSTLMYLKPFHSAFDKIRYLPIKEFKKRNKKGNKKTKKLLNPPFEDIFRNADIISIVNFYSTQEGVMNKIMPNVCELSKSGCMILILDSPMESLVENCGGHSGNCLHKYCIPICDDIFGLHTLKDSTIKEYSDLFEYLCNGVLPNYSMKYFVRIWVKSLFTFPSIKELNLESKKQDLEMWFEMNKLNPVLKNFHLEIEKLKSELENMKEKTDKLSERRDFLKLNCDFLQDNLLSEKIKSLSLRLKYFSSLRKMETSKKSSKSKKRKKKIAEQKRREEQRREERSRKREEQSGRAEQEYKLSEEELSIQRQKIAAQERRKEQRRKREEQSGRAEQEYKLSEEELSIQRQKIAAQERRKEEKRRKREKEKRRNREEKIRKRVEQRIRVEQIRREIQISREEQRAEQEYKAAEVELNIQKQKQEAIQFCFDSNKEELYKLAWKTYCENKRAFVRAELQKYQCFISRPFK